MSPKEMHDQLQRVFPGRNVRVEINIKTGSPDAYWLYVGENWDIFATGESFHDAYIKVLERHVLHLEIRNAK